MTFAIQISTTGEPDVLEWTEIDEPEAGTTDLIVDVHAAGLNFIDTYHRSGLYEVPLPFVPGSEGSGVVVSVGADVDGFGEGDPVAWARVPGSYATRIIVPADRALPVPDGMDLDIAAALPLQGMTAHYLACSTFPVGPDHRCLIHAAAGGTGRLLVQIAKRRGAEVVATAGTPEKVALALSAGADHAINYVADDLVTAVEAAVGANAIDVVFDGVGASTFDAGLALLRPLGTLATFGNASGAVPPVSPIALMAKSLFLTRPKLWDYVADREALLARWSDLTDWVADGTLDVRIGLNVAMADAADAHRAVESRSTTGKILLTT